MYLLLGDLNDLACSGVFALLESRGLKARRIGDPTLAPFMFAWRFDNLDSSSQLVCEDGTQLSDREIDGVLVTKPEKLTAADWNPNDLAYAQAETDAALLAWLWSLNCPVINRYPAALWFYSDLPLLSWYPMLARHGLLGLTSLITNVESEAKDFGLLLGNRMLYAPLSSESRYPIDSDDVWRKVAGILRVAPVHLTEDSLPRFAACVVGSRVVWNKIPPPEARIMESRFIHFSAAAGLAFCEIDLACTPAGVQVTNVKACPRLEHFGPPARHEIIAGLVEMLTGDSNLEFRGSRTEGDL